MNVGLRNLPVAWLQLRHGRGKLIAAVAGIVFADLLMWMQLGFRSAAIDSSLYLHDRLRGALVLINPLTEQLAAAKPFPRRQLVRVLRHPDVESATPLYTGTVLWRDPWTGAKRALFAYGVVPYAPAIGVPGIQEHTHALHEADTCLFDTRSRDVFAKVLQQLGAGKAVEAEINTRRFTVVGTTTIGASFDVDGNLVTSDANFNRLFPQRSLASIDVGVLRLRAGADLQSARTELQAMYGNDLLVLTTGEFKARDKDYFLRTRPVDFIFAMGTGVGVFVGFAIVYQILFTNVTNHLPQYATLKAIGYSDAFLRRIVLVESLILSLLGYVPGALLAAGLYTVTARATSLPMQLTMLRALVIFGLTVSMCGVSGLVAMQKLNQSDPADVF